MKFQSMVLRGFIFTFAAGLTGISAGQAETTREEKVGDFVLHIPGDLEKGAAEFQNAGLCSSVFQQATGDQRPAELAVFNFKGGGSVDQNIKRWIDQFDPEGRKQQLFEGKTANGRYWLANISGTYNKPIGPPFLRKTQSEPGSRVLAMIFVGKQGTVLYLKLVGPDKTVSAQAERMRTVIGAELEAEKPYAFGS